MLLLKDVSRKSEQIESRKYYYNCIRSGTFGRRGNGQGFQSRNSLLATHDGQDQFSNTSKRRVKVYGAKAWEWQYLTWLEMLGSLGPFAKCEASRMAEYGERRIQNGL